MNKLLVFLTLYLTSNAVFADMSLKEIERLHKQDKDELITVRRINYYFNQYPYKKDIVSRNQSDYWKTPLEFLKDNGGDCEDYAIVKYFYLKKLGFPENNLRFFYVLNEHNESHMVLGYYKNNKASPMLLDNEYQRVLLSAKRNDLKPIYSFNFNSIWVNKNFENDEHEGKNIPNKYKNLIKKMEKEDFQYF